MPITDLNPYINTVRWKTYYHQVEQILTLKPNTILEIGQGCGILFSILKHHKYNITSFNNLKELSSDVLGDMRKLSRYFSKDSVNVVCCFQVPEHSPFKDFSICLGKMSLVLN